MNNFLTAVVTFNRKELLVKNIKAQLAQTLTPDYILIIDNNSTDNTYEKLCDEKILNDRVIYYNIGENIGGAGGFEFAIRKSKEFDCEIICLMDDDGRPADNNCFQNAINAIRNNSNFLKEPIFVNSLVMYDSHNLSFPYGESFKNKEDVIKKAKDHILIGYSNPFNGTFINKRLIDEIGYPRGDFFIRFDEVDYFNRAKKANSFMCIVDNSFYYHPAPYAHKKKKFLGILFCDDYEEPWKEYYKFRNSQILRKELGDSNFKIFKRYVKALIGMFVFKKDNKIQIKRALKLAYKHAKKGLLGKMVEPKQIF